MLEDSPALKVAKMLEDSPVMRALDQMRNSPVILAAQSFQNSSFINALDMVENSLAIRIAREISAPTFEFTYDEVIRRNSVFNFDLGTALFEEISTEIKSRAAASPSNQLSAEFYISLIFAIIFYYLSQVSSAEQENRMTDRLDAFETTISDQLSILGGSDKTTHFYVVKTALNLRSGPSLDESIISILPINQKLTGLETQGEWMEIEFFDYLENEIIIGWVHSDNVMPVIVY